MSNADRLLKALKEIGDAADSSSKSKADPLETAKDLKNRFELLDVTHSFHPGQLVQHKPLLSNKKEFAGGVAIVTKVLANPITSTEEDSGSAYFNETLDVVVATITSGSDEFIEFHADSRRLEPYTGPSPKQSAH